MKIYTKTGDAGATGVFDGARVSETGARVDRYGGAEALDATRATEW